MRTAYAVGFSWRKQGFLRSFCDDRHLRFVSHWAQVPSGADVVVWGAAPVPAVLGAARVTRVEDGFLRSVGLGAAFARPVSWVVDDVGMHYDAGQPSALEHLLQSTAFDAACLARAAALRQRILRAGLTKYNLTAPAWQRPAVDRPVCLVVGQVESDASLRLGSPLLRSNLDCVRRVRALRPDAYLVYKPHPDVAAGVRSAGADEGQARSLCDDVLVHADIAQLLGVVDECHVLTSLAGFEALLRGCPVVTHGQPFYAGWGLTSDLLPPARRSRRLTLDELVAGALLLYPRYIHPTSGQRCTAEAVLDELEAARAQAVWWRRRLTAAGGLAAGRLVKAWQLARQAVQQR
jgi:capsular polysaccharide export protein